MIRLGFSKNSLLIGTMRIKLMRLDKNTLSYLTALIKEVKSTTNKEGK